jgi:drug/metabolite transporter (DMT)-like permease
VWSLPYGALFVGVILFGSGGLFVRSISAPYTTILVLRMWFATATTYTLARAMGDRVDARVVRTMTPAGLTFLVSNGLGIVAIHETSVANASLINALMPVVLVIAARGLFGERLSARQLAFGVVSLGGVAMVVLGAASTAGATWSGDLIAAVSMVIFAGYMLIIKHLRTRTQVPAMAALAGLFFVGALGATPIALIHGLGLSALDGKDWLQMAGLVLLPGTVGHFMMTWAQRHVEVTISGLCQLLAVVLTALGGWVCFGQELTGLQILGGLVVLVGLAGVLLLQNSSTTVKSSGYNVRST